MKKRMMAAVCGLLCLMAVSAQEVKRPDSYNYKRGTEAIQNGNNEEALEYLNKDIEIDNATRMLKITHVKR